MSSMIMTIKQERNLPKRIFIEMDAEKFERLAAGLGLFTSDFLESLDRADKDYKVGRVRRIKSLKELRK